MFSTLLTPLLYWSKLMFLQNSTKTYFIYIMSEITLVLFLWLIARAPEWRPRITLTTKLFFLYILILVLASLLGVDPSYSFWGSLDRMGGILTWLHLTAVFVVLTSLMRTQEDWVKFFSFSTAVAVMIAFIHLFSLGGTALIPEARGGATLGNSSFLAVYLLFHTFFSLFLASQQKKKERLYTWLSVCAFFALTLSSVSAVAVHFSLIGGMVLLSILLLIVHGRSKTKKQLGIVLLVLLSIVFLTTTILAFLPESSVHQKFIDLSSGSRFALWDSAWQGIKEKPLFGWGLENFGVVALTHYNPCFGSQACGFEMWFDHAHNKLLDVWIESGILGLLLYLGIWISSIRELWLARQKKNITGTTFAIFSALLAAYFVQNLTVLDTITSLLLWIMVLAFSNSQEEPAVKKSRPLPLAIPTIATMFLPFAFFFFVIQPLRGNLGFEHVLNATDLDTRLEAYERATTLSPLGIDMRRIFLGDQTSSTYWKIPVETLRSIEPQARLELGLAQAGLMDSLGHKNQELRAHIALGIMYQTEGHFFDPAAFEKAEEILLKAIELYPLIPQPKWTLAGVYLDEGKLDEALAMTQSVLDASPLSPQAYNYQLIVLKWMDDTDAFEKLAAQALQLIPNLQSDIDQLTAVDLQTRSQEVLTSFHR